MIRYFRINDPYRLAGIFVVFLILFLPLFVDPPPVGVSEFKAMIIGEKLNEGHKMYTEVIDNSAPLAAWAYELLDTLAGRSILARHILSFLFIFLQAAYVGIMMINRKVFNENTFIPSFIFLLLLFFSYDSLSFTGELLGSVFLLLALNNIFKEIEFRTQRDETVFNLGAYIGIASLFSFGYWIFIFFAIAALISSGRMTIRRVLLLVFGFIMPHLLIVSVTLLSGVLPDIWRYFYVSNLSLDRRILVEWKALLALSAIPVFYFAVSLIMLQREARFSKYQSLLLQLMFLWIGFCIVYLLFCKDLRPQNLIVFAPALTILLTHFLLTIRRRKLVELNGWLLLAGMAAVSYMSRYDMVESMDYGGLRVKAVGQPAFQGKRLLVLDDDIGYYLENRLATPYLDWDQAQPIFSGPGYYENVVHVYEAFTNDPPDVVVDKRNYLKPFLERIPELGAQYRRRGDVYVRVIGN